MSSLQPRVLEDWGIYSARKNSLHQRVVLFGIMLVSEHGPNAQNKPPAS